jgi:nucleotide-binding universal stress UspA family protein
MRTILAPVSFGVNALISARYAADLALVLGADLELIHVVQVPGSYPWRPVPESVFRELQDGGYFLLHDLAEGLRQRTGGKLAIGTTLDIGEPADKLREYCEREDPFLVVMGAGEKTGNQQTVRAMQRLPYPLLIIPIEAVFLGIRRVAIACDQEDIFSGVSAALPFLRELDGLPGVKLEVVHVVTGGRGTEAMMQEYEGLKKGLPAFGERLHFVWEEIVERGIEGFLKRYPVDWLFVLPKRHLLLSLHKSRAREIGLRSPVPVMSLHE